MISNSSSCASSAILSDCSSTLARFHPDLANNKKNRALQRRKKPIRDERPSEYQSQRNHMKQSSSANYYANKTNQNLQSRNRHQNEYEQTPFERNHMKNKKKTSHETVSIDYANNKKRYARNVESSEISSNNLTLSELESSSQRSTLSDSRLQRRKFIKCILREDVDLLKALLDNQQDILNIRDKHKNSLMHIACGFGRLRSVQMLMKLCPKLVETVDDREHTPIDVAIKHGQIDVVKWLLSKTNRILIDVQQKLTSCQQRSCIHLAAKHGENEILKFILSEMYKNQLSIDLTDSNGNTAAHLAAKYGHLDCLCTLIEYNCDITIVNKYGQTPCFVAEYHGNHECVHYLMIVETCINLSIKVVKIGRKLRETKTNNEILKAQMDEAIAINNDFINQRENVMNISLDLMQKQIGELEVKCLHEIERLHNENANLREKIYSLNANTAKQAPTSKQVHFVQSISNTNDLRFNSSSSNSLKSNQSDQINNDDMNNLNDSKLIVQNEINNCKQELINTTKNCEKLLRMDQKRLDNVKQRFDEIKLCLDSTSETTLNNNNNKCNMSNCDNSDILENKEHIEVLRKMYQEATHKLMIFRNALKEKQTPQSSKNVRESSKYSPTQQLSSSSSSSTSMNYMNNPSPSSNNHHNHNQQSSYQMNNMNQMENRRDKLTSSSSSTSSSSNSKSRNGYAQRNLSDLDELTEEDQERNYYNNNFQNSNSNEVNINNVLNNINQNQNNNKLNNNNLAQDSNSLTQSISNSQNTIKTNPNYYNAKLNQIISSNSNNNNNNNKQQENENENENEEEHDENYDYSGDETLSDDEYRLIEDENDDDFELDDENNLNRNIQHFEDEQNEKLDENVYEPTEDEDSKANKIKSNFQKEALNDSIERPLANLEEYEIPIQTEVDEEDTIIGSQTPTNRNVAMNSPPYFAENTNSTSSTSSRNFYSRTIKQNDQVVIEEKYENRVENNLNEMFHDRVERNQLTPKMTSGKYLRENNQMRKKNLPVNQKGVEIKPIIRCETKSNTFGQRNNKTAYKKNQNHDEQNVNQEQYFLINDDEENDFKMNFYKIKQKH